MDKEDTPANYIAGTPYTGAKVVNIKGPGGYQGELVAWDVAHARKVWGIKETVTVQVVGAVLRSEGTACALRCNRMALPR